MVRLSPYDAPHLVVRHAEFRLRVEGNVREVADSWFRFNPGHLGTGAVAVHSVNYPDRHVTAGDGVLRIEPYADPDSYVSHDNGRLVVARPGRGRAERARATFLVR